jgi:DNA-binding MarR family transcriptional regulator
MSSSQAKRPLSTQWGPVPDSGAGENAFANEMEHRLGTWIKRAEQALIAEKTRVLRPIGLTVPQYAAMGALYYVPGQSAAQLARTAAVSPQTMATILANLETKGLISRTPSALHSKVLVTRLTEEGEALIKKADAAARAVEIRLAQGFSGNEQAQLRNLLERSIESLDPNYSISRNDAD